jgi:hypothetical protein
MKIQTLKRLIMMSALGILAAVSAHAQSSRQFTVTIPFDFSVGGKALAAGQYQVSRATQTSAEGLVLRRADGGGSVFVLTRTAKNQPGESRLVFRRYEDRYFLGEVWISGASAGRELPMSHRERSIAQEIAKNGATPQKTSVLAERH